MTIQMQYYNYILQLLVDLEFISVFEMFLCNHHLLV